MAEEFTRCEQCGQAWFEKKEFVLVHKDSPMHEKPTIYKREIQYVCVGCGYKQYEEVLYE